MSRRIGNDEFAFGRGEITVGYVYGDTLFALGGKAVCQAGKIRRFSVFCSAVELVNLVGQQGFAVVEQAADERGFAVINTAGGDEA